MNDTTRSRRLIWIAWIIQMLAFVFEGLWHGLNPEFERDMTVASVRAHLSTVHLPFYGGIVALLVATGWALIQHVRQGKKGLAVPLLFAAALGQAIGQIWDASAHLRMSTGGPVAWTLVGLGLVGVPATLIVERRGSRR
jgi:hypothetical protein